MTQEQYDSLLPGDVVKNTVNSSLKVVLPNGYPCEPIVAIGKDKIKERLDLWEIHSRSKRREQV